MNDRDRDALNRMELLLALMLWLAPVTILAMFLPWWWAGLAGGLWGLFMAPVIRAAITGDWS